MVQMDVRDEHGAHVAEPDPALLQQARQCGPRRRRTRVNQRDTLRPVQQGGRDDFTLPEKLEVERFESA